ncbi:Transmembrane 9 superfamily member 4 [Amphibalanus amphitrite]|uniref:Transmembrane 9 superfamily member n=1 Tax=Amphibalanus amphitrite TaxID=1232801 RepID=A0A6A4V8S7_AMPAM|nr:Transmembrane 9 superfamily member 4 [Amphibalanus amphitrite]
MQQRRRLRGLLSLLVALLASAPAGAFYVPGVAPVEFEAGSPIKVQAIKLTSTHTQLPYDYYSLPLCRPKNGTLVYKSENLGEVLRGDRIVNTPYEVHMKKDVVCQVLCNSFDNPMSWTKEDTNEVISRIQHEYTVHLLVDNLPCATRFQLVDSDDEQLDRGYRLGSTSENGDETYINNHLRLVLYYHTEDNLSFRVVRFEVETRSVDQAEQTPGGCSIPKEAKKKQLIKDTETRLLFTYSVEWRQSSVRWASRWDVYLAMSDVQIHWFSIVNSVVVVLFLSGILTMIIIRTLRRDIAKYNQDDSLEEAMEETGWKLVHGDVFRPPQRAKLFCALVGSGVQIYLMALVTIFFATLGMLSPSSRGSLMTAAITLYNFMGVLGGYFSGRLYKTMKGKMWKSTALWTGVLYPLVVSSIVVFLNFFVWGKRSSGAIPFTSMLSVLAMWFGISVPLVLLGSYVGFRKPPYEHPVRTNQIPRQVPEQAWYLHPIFCSLLAGVLPFGAMFIELFFIFSAIWENQFYYMFGFLFLVYIILTISCSQISIVLAYFQLCGEDYHWWWRSFVVSGGSAIYVGAYSFFYFFTKLEIDEFVPTLLYFGYTAIIVITFWLLTGTIGFWAAYTFIKKIYGAVKID